MRNRKFYQRAEFLRVPQPPQSLQPPPISSSTLPAPLPPPPSLPSLSSLPQSLRPPLAFPASPNLLQHPPPRVPQTPQPSALSLSAPSSLLAGHLLTAPPGTGTCSGPRRGLGVRTQSYVLGTPPSFQKRRQGRDARFKPAVRIPFTSHSEHVSLRRAGRRGEGGRRAYSKGSHTRYCPSSVHLC